MSSVQSTHVFTSESVSEGHPDKIADQISDAILDACIRHDPNAHVACETAVGPNLVVNLGEITCKGWEKVDSEAIAREVVREIGYVRPDEAFSFDTFEYKNALHGQSPDISQGVDRGSCENQGAGDQGIMFVDGKKHGNGKEYDKYKNLIYEGEYFNGKKHGKGKEYNKNGIYEVEYLNGEKINEKYISKIKKQKEIKEEYYKNGNLKFEGEYLRGKKMEKEKNIIKVEI